MLQDGSETHETGARSADAIVDNVIVCRVGRGQSAQGAIRLSGFETEPGFSQFCGGVLVAALGVVQFKSPEIRLGIRQDVFH